MRILKAVKRHIWVLLLAAFLSFLWALPLFCVHSLRLSHPNFPQDVWEKNPSNGQIATSFLLHIHPYWLFSEDYHLYLVRAKRISRFGFVNEIMEPAKSTGYDFRNAVQVAVTMIPALVGHDVRNYAIIYWVYLTAGIFLIYLVTFRWGKDRSFAVMISTVVLLIFGERYFRLSTYLLSLPVLLWGVYNLFSLFEGWQECFRVRLRNLAALMGLLLVLSHWNHEGIPTEEENPF